MLVFFDDEYYVRSKIANSRSMPFQERYPVILRPDYAITYEGPDDMEYCILTENQDYIPEDEYDPGCCRACDEQDYGVRRRTRYPDGYDG